MNAGPGSARCFICQRCRTRTCVCSSCDRGQIYCSALCSGQARKAYQRACSDRYQASRCGKLAHAKRTAAWRARQREPLRLQKKVTQQGCQITPCNAVLPAPSLPTPLTPAVAPSPPTNNSPPSITPHTSCVQCHWCARWCDATVRIGFLHTQRTSSYPKHLFAYDHSP